jgi:hypothetical protein
MNYNRVVMQVASSVSDYVNNANRPPFSVFLRSVRLRYGVGGLSVRRILREDYSLVVVDDKLEEV